MLFFSCVLSILNCCATFHDSIVTYLQASNRVTIHYRLSIKLTKFPNFFYAHKKKSRNSKVLFCLCS